jgi:Sulfatase
MLKKLCQSLGLASLILLPNFVDLLGGGSNVRLHFPFALGGIIAAQIADILILGLVIFAALALLQRTRLHNWSLLILAVVTPPYLIFRTETLLPFPLPSGLVPIIAVVWAATLLLIYFKFPRLYRLALRAGDVIGIFFAAFAFLTIAQLLWVLRWRPAPQQKTGAWETTPQPPRQHPLLVWVVFDELSYDQTFEHRAPGLALPNFDRLRAQSTVFTNVQPAGYKTAKILPSLLSGQPIDDFRYTFDNRFLVHNTGQPHWQLLNGSHTLFADARNNGWRTAAVGWYNPYCGIYADALDICYWTNFDYVGPMSQRYTLIHNISFPLQQAAEELTVPSRADLTFCNHDVSQHLQSHLDLEQQALQVLKTDQADFVFLHLPIPHSPSIWRRSNGQYTNTCGSSYLDNLALTDLVLGHILDTLQSSPRWKDTTLIVQGDHSWRINLWNTLPTWSPEDNAASHDTFDPRPALLIHTPNHSQPITNTSPWPLLQIHDVIQNTLKQPTK